jgi:hypothetical protein
LLIVHKGGGARSCSCSCREAQKGGAKGRRKARGAGPMVVFYSGRYRSIEIAPLGPGVPDCPSTDETKDCNLQVRFVLESPLHGDRGVRFN